MLKFYKKLTLEERKDFNKELTEINYKLSRIIMLIVAVIGAFLIIITLIGQPLSDIGRPFMYLTDYLYLWCYLVLFVFCALYSIILYFFYKCSEAHIKGIRVMTLVFAQFISAWSICISLLEIYYQGFYSPIVMLMVFMGLAGAMHMYPWESLAIFAMSLAIYLIAGFVIATKVKMGYITAGTLFGIVVFLAIATMISFAKFENRVKGYILNRKLRNQNSELFDANAQLTNLNEQLEKISITDRLTGIRNRWAFTSRLKEVYDKCKSEKIVMSVAIFDLDDFKLVNDKHGHAVGDQCLKDIAEIFKLNVPLCDLFRYGGEEFIMIFHGLSENEVYKITDDIRRQICECTLAGCGLDMTISGGQFSCVPSDSLNEDRFLVNADRALYAAKRAGKNRVEVYNDKKIKH